MKLKMEFDVKRYENVGFSPAWDYIPHALASIQRSGLQPPRNTSPAVDEPVLIAFDKVTKEVAGFMVYKYLETMSEWWISLSFIRHQYRREGIHTLLFSTLVERAKARDDILAINCGTHVDNLPAQAAFEKQGRVPVSIVYSYPIRQFYKDVPLIEVRKEDI